MTIHLGCLLPDTSSCQPGPARSKALLWQAPRAVPIWHCSRWGLPCRRCCQPRGGLLPHRFTLTLVTESGLFSVALSLGFPRPGVTRHRCFVESGLSSRANAPTAIQLSARPRNRASALSRQSLPATCRSRAATRASSALQGPSAQGRNRARNASKLLGFSRS